MIITRRFAPYFIPLLLLCTLAPHHSQAAEVDLTCPDTPNCVSSQAQGEHFIAPLTFARGSRSEIRQQLKDILTHWPRTEIVSSASHTLEVVITSRWMGFKDDLLLVINPDKSVDVRSSSRTGHYDFGVNRDRVEQLRHEIHR